MYLTLTNIEHHITVSLSRKEICTDTTIPNSYLSSYLHNLVSYKYIMHRAFIFPLSETDLTQEFNVINLLTTKVTTNNY